MSTIATVILAVVIAAIALMFIFSIYTESQKSNTPATESQELIEGTKGILKESAVEYVLISPVLEENRVF